MTHPLLGKIVAALLVAGGLTVVPVASSTAGGPAPSIVTVADMQFTPKTLRVPMIGTTVHWEFQDSMPHTTTSDQGFWDSGTRSSGDTFTHTFRSAGTFPYHCSIHSSMHGTIVVPVNVTGSPQAGWTLRWTTSAPEGELYDVQIRKGHGKWKALRSNTRTQSVSFSRAGRWSVRARTIDGEPSGWSPATTFKVS